MRGIRLRTKMSLVFLLLTFMPLLGVSLYMFFQGRAFHLQEAKEKQHALTNAVRELVWQHLGEARNELDGFGRFLTLDLRFLRQSAPRPQAQRRRRTRPLPTRKAPNMEFTTRKLIVKSFLKSARLIHQVAIYNPQGQIVQGFWAWETPSMQKSPKTLSLTLRKRAQSKGIAYGNTVVEKGTQTNLPVVVPVFVNKKLYAYLRAPLGLDALGQELGKLSRKYFSDQKHPKGRNDAIFILDRAAHTVVHADAKKLGTKLVAKLLPEDLPSRHDARAGQHLAYITELSHSGRDHLICIAGLEGLRWNAITLRPSEQIYGRIRRVWFRALLLSAIIVLLALFLGQWFGVRLSRPVLQVAKAAQRVAGGDFETRVSVQAQDEVGEMATAFNKMAGDLKEYEETVIEETRIRTDLTRYLSSEIVDTIIANKDGLRLGGERRRVTVLFADVVAFTPLTEKHSPEKIVAILNEVFTFMTEIIFRHGGIIDKFMGDCVMAVFGAPYAHEDDPIRAVGAAEEMLEWLETGNARWAKELGAPLEMGIGINTGEVVAGNIGSEKRMEYTVIGDIVNIAARLESLARPGQVLMTRETMSAVKEDFECQSLGSFAVTGRKEEIEIFLLDTEY